MYGNHDLTQALAGDRMAGHLAEAGSARGGRTGSAARRAARPALRFVLGDALIALGQRLAGGPADGRRRPPATPVLPPAR